MTQAYSVRGELGRGGGGVVYDAVLSDGRRCALKRVEVPDAETAASLRREMATLAALDHRGIVPMMAHGIDDHGRPWLASARLDGTRLSDWRGSREEALLVMADLCDALAHVHAAGLVHADLTPANVLVTQAGPVLVDFGLSQTAAHRERAAVAQRAGTLAYMAPEQLRGELLDARADLYAVGVILYELLEGRLPFAGTPHEALARRQLLDAPPAGNDPLWPVVASLLAKSRRGRPGYATEVAATLREGAGLGPAMTPVAPQLYRPAFTGRGRVHDAMRRYLADVGRRRESTAVSLVGPSGIGKTRFAVELARQLAAQGWRVFPGSSGASREETLVLGPLRPALQAVVDGGAGLSSTTRSVLSPFVEGLDAQPPAPLPEAAEAERLVRCVMDTLVGDVPTLVLIDDLQWADSATLAFVRALPGSGVRGLVALSTCRSESPSPEVSGALDASRVLEIGGLDAEAIAEVVADMLSGTAPAPLLDFAVRHAHGNPYMAAEVARAAVEMGVVERSAGWVVGDLTQVPTTLTGLLSGRLARLPEAARTLAACAAILGRDISELALTRMPAMAEAEAIQAVSALIRRQILEPAAGAGLRFCHDKLREAALAALDDEAKAQLHAAAATALASLSSGGAAWELRVGRHFVLAGHDEHAWPRLLEAARAGLRLRQLEVAEEALRLCLGLDGDAHRLVARRMFGRLAVDRGRFREAVATASEAIAEARQRGDEGELAELLVVRADAQRALGEMDAAREALTEAGDLFEALGDTAGLGRQQTRFGGMCFELGDNENAEIFLTRALGLHREVGAKAEEAWALMAVFVVRFRMGRLDGTMQMGEDAISLCREVGDARRTAVTLVNVAAGYSELGDVARAEAMTVEAIDIYRRTDDWRSLAVALGNLAEYQHHRDDTQEAMRTHEEAIELAIKLGDRRTEGISLANLGTIHREAGDFDEARRCLERAVALAREVASTRHEGHALVDLAILERTVGAVAIAGELLARARALFQEASEWVGLTYVACELGFLAHEAGRDPTPHLREGERLASEAGVTGDGEITRRLERLRALVTS